MDQVQYHESRVAAGSGALLLVAQRCLLATLLQPFSLSLSVNLGGGDSVNTVCIMAEGKQWCFTANCYPPQTSARLGQAPACRFRRDETTNLLSISTGM